MFAQVIILAGQLRLRTTLLRVQKTKPMPPDFHQGKDGKVVPKLFQFNSLYILTNSILKAASEAGPRQASDFSPFTSRKTSSMRSVKSRKRSSHRSSGAGDALGDARDRNPGSEPRIENQNSPLVNLGY